DPAARAQPLAIGSMPLLPPPTTGRRPSGSEPDFCHSQALFRELLSTSLVVAEDWEKLESSKRTTVTACRGQDDLFKHLVEFGLLTSFQASRLRAGKSFGLTLGNY